MTSKLILSIVTVTLNDKHAIQKTYRSLESHLNGPNSKLFEWLIVDGESTDGSLDVYHELLKLVKNF